MASSQAAYNALPQDSTTTTLDPHQSLEACIRARHSIRMYRPDPVDRELLLSCLRLARWSASNSNIQNWRLILAQGGARDRIVSALRIAASNGEPNVPPLPDKFKQFRSDFGKHLYGSEAYGIPRSDTEALASARLRNFTFFDAPVVGIITMDSALAAVDAMSVGLFVQTFILALTERRLGSCLEVSVTGYEEVLRKEFGIDEGQMVLCGIAIGWPAEHRVNHLQLSREPVEEDVTFLDE